MGIPVGVDYFSPYFYFTSSALLVDVCLLGLFDMSSQNDLGLIYDKG